jgi:hypothetical protein
MILFYSYEGDKVVIIVEKTILRCKITKLVIGS